MMRPLFRFILRLFPWMLSAASRNGQNVVTALVQIWANKGRSILTTLGIIIAVTSIITVVSFMQGFGNYITEMVRGYGTQFMVVRPDRPANMHRSGLGRVTLDLNDIEAVRTECPAVSRITPFVFTPDAKIVLSWRGSDDGWAPGHYSTATFSLDPIDGGTRLTFVQTGVPEKSIEQISQGWHTYYWPKMKQMLES